MSAQLPGIRACVFDAYGTIFDYASAAARHREALGERFQAFSALWRDKQLQYTWLRSLQGLHADFWVVTGDALDYALDAFEIRDAALRERLMAAYLHLDAFPDAIAALRRLKMAGMPTAILSNGTPGMLRSAVFHAGIHDLIDAVISVEEAGVFKTHPRVYQSALDHLGVPANAVSFQSSNGWDAYAASAFGMRVIWCNRAGQPAERLPGAPDREIRSLAELPAIVGV